MTLAERFDAWAREYERKGQQKGVEEGIEQGIEQGIEKGIEKGIKQGEALALQRLLAKRFGPLPAEAVQTISTASAAQVELWLDRLLDADSVEAVLKR